MRGLAGTEQCAAGVVVAYPVQCDVDVHNKLTLRKAQQQQQKE